MLNYTEKPQNTYIQSWTVWEIMASEVWNFDSCLHTYWLPNSYWNWQEYVVFVMLISVINIKLTSEWHKAIKLNYKKTRTNNIVVVRVPSTIHDTCMSNGDVTCLAANSRMWGSPHHVGSTFGSVSFMGCFPTNLVTHSAGRLHKHFPFNCCQRQKVRSTCYQAHHTIHSL